MGRCVCLGFFYRRADFFFLRPLSALITCVRLLPTRLTAFFTALPDFFAFLAV